MRSRSFLHVSLGILALAAAYHLGARKATAQSPQEIIGYSFFNEYQFVITPGGDVYRAPSSSGTLTGPAVFMGNFWGGATSARQESFGGMKARYR